MESYEAGDLHCSTFNPSCRKCWRSNIFRDLANDEDEEYITPKIAYAQNDVDKPGSAGVEGQLADKENSTILTADNDVEESTKEILFDTPKLDDASSTEPLHSFDSVLNRWILIKQMKITTGTSFDKGQRFLELILPKDLFLNDSCSPNVLPFQQFIYTKLDIDLQIKINSTKVQTGKIIVGVMPNSDNINLDEALYNTMHGALQRRHVMLDFGSKNDAVLHIDWLYHKSFMRAFKHSSDSQGSSYGQFCKVQFYMLSKLRASDTGSTTVGLSVFGRIKKANFAGISYAVKPQMLGIAKQGVSTFKGVLEHTEQFLDNVDRLVNMDKPTDLFSRMVVIPSPRLSLGHGRGPADCTPMRLDPSALTSYTGDHTRMLQSTSLKAIMRTWSLLETVEWTVGQENGDYLTSWNLNPSNLKGGKELRHYTTLEYVCNFFQFWRGTIEFRFDFVSNIFQSGSLQIAAEFGRQMNQDLCASGSAYVKDFDLGEQKSVTFIVPYIYDTVWRRNQVAPYGNLGSYPRGDRLQHRDAVRQFVSSKLSLRVVNALKVATTGVASTVDILVFVRAGASFATSGLIANNLFFDDFSQKSDMDDFPGEYSRPPMAKLAVMDEPVATTMENIESTTSTTAQTPIETTVHASQTPIVASTTQREQLDEILPAKADKLKAGDLTSLERMNTNPIYANKHRRLIKSDALTYLPGLYIVYDNNGKPINAFAKNVEGIYRPIDKDDYKILLESYLPYAQANTQEDIDQTPNFSAGKNLMTIQTSERQMDMVDILRRPTMMMYNVDVKRLDSENATNGGLAFHIPLMPLQHGMFGRYNHFFLPSVIRSPSVAITTMFRMWRGSMRYTFVFRDFDPVKTTIYITVAPHSGVRGLGNKGYMFGREEDTAIGLFHPASSGVCTELVVPSINPTAHVEVPFMTELNWALLHQGRGGLNERIMGWRDKTDDNVGHLTISSTTNVKMDVFWAAGDDFRLSGFLGTVVGTNCQDIYYDDNCVGVQALWDTVHGYLPGFKESVRMVSRPAAIAVAGAVAPSMVVPVAACLYGNVLNKADAVVEGIHTAVDKVNQELLPGLNNTTNKTSIILDSISDCGSEVADVVKYLTTSILKPFSGTFYKELYDKTSGILMEFFRAWMAFSPMNVAISIVSILNQLGLITWAWSGRILSSLTNLVTHYLFPPVEANIGEEVCDEAGFNDLHLANFCGLAVAAVGAMFAVDTSFVQSPLKFGGGLFKQLLKPTTWAVLTHATRFFKDTIELFKRVAYSIAGYKDIKTEAILQLTTKSDFLKKFVRDANLFLMESNTAATTRLPGQKLKFWMTLMNAHQILNKVIYNPKEKVSSILLSLCKDVIKKGNELHVQMSNCPVRYEPFVLCVSGKPGIGKSFFVDELATTLLRSIGFSEMTSEIKYVKNPAPAFWNGYKDQPVIVFDDFLNIRTSPYGEEQVTDLYNLKSSAIFNPNMARLEEKEIRANPLLVILVTNDPFPELNFITEKNAVLRRRDYMVDVTLKEGTDMNVVRASSCDNDAKYDHLIFNTFDDVTRKDSYNKRRWTKDQFISDVVAKFQTYHKQEQIFVKQRIEKIHALLPEYAQTYGAVEDPFSLFYSTIANVDADASLHHDTIMLPSEMIDLATTRIVSQLEASRTVANVESQAGVPIAKATQSMLKLWKSKIENMFVTHLNDNNGQQGKCVVCLAETIVHLGCVNSTESNSHTVCRHCAMSMCRTTIKLTCPVCRSGELHDIGEPESIFEKIKRVIINAPLNMAISTLEVTQIVLSSAFKFAELATIITPMRLLMFSVMSGFTGKSLLPLTIGGSLIWRFANNVVFDYDYTLGGVRVASTSGQVLNDYGSESVEDFVDAVSRMDNINDLPHEQVLYRGRSVIINSEDITEDTLDQVCKHGCADYSMASYERREDGEDMFFQLDLDTMESVEFSLKRCTKNCYWSRIDQVTWLREWANVNSNFLLQTLNLSNGQAPSDFMPICLIPTTHTEAINRIDHVRNFDAAIDELTASNWWDLLKCGIGKTLATLIPYMKYALLAIGVITAIKNIYKWICPGAMDEEQMGAGRYNANSTPVRTPAARAIRFVNRVSEQSGCSPAINAVMKNLGHFTIIQEGLEEAWLSWVGICNHFILINKHSFTYMIKKERQCAGKEFKVRLAHNPKVTYDVIPSLLETVDISLTDLICVKLPPYVPLFKNIKKFFISQEKLYGSTLGSYGKMVEPPQYKEYEGTTIRDIDFTRYLSEKLVHGSDEDFTLQDIVEYNYSRKGACGGVVMSDLQDQPILGIHSAGIGVGSNGLGFAVIVTKENLEMLEVVEQADLPMLLDEEPELYFPEDTNLVVEGTVSDHLKSYIPNKTKLRPSLITDWLAPPLTEPTILTNRDPRHNKEWLPPLIAGIIKQQVSVKLLNSSVLEEIMEHVLDTKLKFSPTTVSRKTLTYEEAIIGFKDVDYFDVIPMDTSAGWPWVCQKRKKNKRALIELTLGKDNYPIAAKLDPLLLDALKSNENKRKQNILAPIVTTDMLKDERKKISSRKEGGTRLFSCYPVDGTIAMRQHFLHYASAMMSNRFDTKMAIGVARDGPEWASLLSYLHQVGDKFVCLDYSNFGPSFSAQVFEKVIMVILDWHKFKGFSDEHIQQLKIILLEHMQCRHIARDAVYITTAGSPSGSPGTALLNSEVNIFYVMYAWKIITGLPLYVFEDHVRLVTYGDDLIMTVSDKFIGVFNTLTIQEVFLGVNIKISSSSKGVIEKPYVPLEEADFLKSRFVPHPYRKYQFLAPMDWTSVEECAKWIHFSDDNRQATLVNAETSLRLAYAHGEVKFNEWKRILNKALVTASLDTLKLTWKDCDRNFFDENLKAWLPVNKHIGNAVYLVPHI